MGEKLNSILICANYLNYMKSALWETAQVVCTKAKTPSSLSLRQLFALMEFTLTFTLNVGRPNSVGGVWLRMQRSI